MPEINSGSAADVSFLLLLFFILTSSVGLNKVMPAKMSPPTPDNERPEPVLVKERNFLPLFIDENDRIVFRSVVVEPVALRALVKEFIDNPEENDDLPEKTLKDDPLMGGVEVSDLHVISLSAHDKSHFQTYVFVQNELLAAYGELRNELAFRVFDKPYRELSEDLQQAVGACYPRRISKPEKIMEGGNK